MHLQQFFLIVPERWSNPQFFYAHFLMGFVIFFQCNYISNCVIYIYLDCLNIHIARVDIAVPTSYCKEIDQYFQTKSRFARKHVQQN